MKDQFYRITAAVWVIMAALMMCATAGVFAGSNKAVTADITVTYIVKGNAGTAGGDTVTLTPDDPASPMPGGTEAGKKTITIRNEGSYSFGEMRYDSPGVHWYTITRNVTKRKGVTKDDSVYKAKVIALNDGHGYVVAYKEGSDEKCEPVYTDKVAPLTGDSGRMIFYCVITLAAAVPFAALTVIRIRNRRKEARNGSG